MLFGLSLPVVVLAAGGLLYAAGTVGAYRVDEPGTGALAVSALLLTVAASVGVAAAAGFIELTGSWRALVVTGSFVATIPWTVFALQYTGNGEIATRPRITLAAVPPLVIASATISEVVVGFSLPFETQSIAGVVAASGLLTVALVLGGTVLQLYTTLAYDSVRLSSGLALWLPLGAPVSSALLANTVSAPALFIASTTLLGGGALVAGTVTTVDVFDTTPAAGRYGRRRLADEITDPVAFLDADGDVIETNDVFNRQFEVTETGATGDPLPAVIGATLSQLVGADSVELITAEGRRQFAPRVSQLRDHRDRVRGTIVVLADITDQKLREQRLAVLNRVVRHNLRNELSVVRGFAEEIGNDGVSNDLAADRIVQASDNLITLGERAREAARLLDHEPETREVELGALVSDVAAELHDEATNLTVETDVPPDARVETDPDLLYRSVNHLAQNAVVHNDADSPRVVISVVTDRDGAYPVEVIVRDNGPGIPAHEWAAIEQAKETPLEHGSGLGLWAVRWGVTRLGGELRYEPNEPRGSVVKLHLPQADEVELSVVADPTVDAATERA